MDRNHPNTPPSLPTFGRDWLQFTPEPQPTPQTCHNAKMISVLTQSSQSAIPPRSSILALSLTVMSSLWSIAAFAQSWATVDDFSPDASAYAVKADASGNIFASGAVKDSTGRYHALITKSGDGGT